MGVLTTIAMLVLFPLNSLLVLQRDLAVGNGEKNSIESIANASGQVQGVETAAINEFPNALPAPPAEPAPIRLASATDLKVVGAHSSVVMDADSSTMLESDNAHEHRQIASLTKLMTAIFVMEKIKDLDEPVTIDEEEVYIEGTKIGCPRSGYCISQRLKVGEQLKAGELLKAMLMNSANDAAVALGKHIGGTQDKFADIMNAKAKAMGLADTHFCTPSGLDLDDEVAAAGCYSSAHDIAAIAAYSLRYDKIWDTFRLPNNLTITSIDGKTVHTILNTDMVLDQVPNLIGGKTGFTPLAGYSLLMAAKDPSDKHTVISVLLDDPYRWSDIKTMFNWAFKSYSWQ